MFIQKISQAALSAWLLMLAALMLIPVQATAEAEPRLSPTATIVTSEIDITPQTAPINQPINEPDHQGSNSKQMAPVMLSSEEQLMKVSFALVLVLALIYGIAWFFKRNHGLKNLVGLPIKTLAMAPMGVKEKIVLIEIGDKQILLGMTPNSIQTLATFDEPILQAPVDKQSIFARKMKDIMAQALNEKSSSDK